MYSRKVKVNWLLPLFILISTIYTKQNLTTWVNPSNKNTTVQCEGIQLADNRAMVFPKSNIYTENCTENDCNHMSKFRNAENLNETRALHDSRCECFSLLVWPRVEVPQVIVMGGQVDQWVPCVDIQWTRIDIVPYYKQKNHLQLLKKKLKILTTMLMWLYQ